MKSRFKNWFNVIVSGILIFTITLTSTPVFALTDEQWATFNANGIYYWNPEGNCSTSGGYAGVVSGENNEAKIWNYFVSANINGISNNPAAIAGILGNFRVESGYNPFAVSASGTYYGLYQTNSSNMISTVNSIGDYWNSSNAPEDAINRAIDIELEFLINDRFAAPEQRFGAYTETALNSNIENSAEGAKIYAELFMVAVERSIGGNQPLQSSEAKNLARDLGIGQYADTGWQATENRRNYAAEVYDQYASSTPTGTIETLDPCKTSSPYTGSGIPQYFQCGESWSGLMYGPDGIHGSRGSTICESGCGPTSFAMMATALLRRNIYPDEVADLAGKKGMHAYSEEAGWIGSSWAITQTLAKAYGLQFQAIDSCNVDAINSLLRDGWMIHTSGAGSTPFTKGGHYIGIAGINDSGEWYIVDSAHGNKYYSPNTVINAGMRCDNVKAIKK